MKDIDIISISISSSQVNTNSRQNHHHSQLNRLRKRRRLTDCLDWIESRTGLDSESALVILQKIGGAS
jgi:hypothetical protein